MKPQADSLNSPIVSIDEADLPPAPPPTPGPIPPKLKELLDRERELLRRYGKLPPAPDTPPPEQPPAPPS